MAPCLSSASETKGLKQLNCKIAGRELKVTALAFSITEVDMWKVYKWNGHYIMGDLVSEHSSEAAALKAARRKLKFKRSERSKLPSFKARNEIVIWLDADNGTPLGLIIKKTRKKTKTGDD